MAAVAILYRNVGFEQVRIEIMLHWQNIKPMLVSV
jgi:hypothetical protein